MGAVKKFGTHFLFNLGQGMAQGWLGNEKFFGCLGDVPAVRYRDNVLQFSKIHKPSIETIESISYFSSIIS